MSEQYESIGTRLVEAYDRMMERVKEGLENMEHVTSTAFFDGLEEAKKTAVELEELTHEEAERVAAFLKRDVQDAGAHMAATGDDLKSWLRFDLEQIESRMVEALMSVADRTTVELARLNEEASTLDWHTGEVTGIGTLECVRCGEQLHFHQTGHIPPCPKCRATQFRRVATEE